MFSFCTDPDTLGSLRWFACYLTTGVHMSFYVAFLKVLGLLAITAPVALGFGFLGAMAARSQIAPLRWIGKTYIALVRGVPDIAFFLFFVIALDQAFEWTRHKLLCPDWDQPIRQGNDFIVCDAAKLPLNNAAQWVHETYGFALAVLTFAIVFGAFAANVLFGAMRAVPHAQLETADAYGHEPPPDLLADPGAADVGLCAAGPVEPLDGADQGHAAAVPAGHRGHRLLGARAGRHQDAALHRLSAWRLADVVFPLPAGLLPRLHPGLRGAFSSG